MEEANQILQKTGEKLGETLQQVRKTTMEASEKVQTCFDSRLGSLVVGVIMAVISGLSVLVSVGSLVFINVLVGLGYNMDLRRNPVQNTFRVDDVIIILIYNACITAGLIFSLMEFSFSVVLADGASKKKTGHLKAYIVYGNIKSVVLFIISIFLFILVWDNVPGYLTLLFCGLNVMFTLMAYGAYKNIKKSVKGYNKFDEEMPVQE